MWEDALKEGLTLAERPYFLYLGLDRDPFSEDPVTTKVELTNFETEMKTLLILIGKAGTHRSHIIPIIRLNGGGGTSLVNSFVSIVSSLKKRKKTETREFLRHIKIECINARFFLEAINDENLEEPDSETPFFEWIARIAREGKTHIIIDNCEVLHRYSIFPYIDATLDCVGRALVFIPCLTPSSYNRLLRDVAVSSIGIGLLLGEVVIRPFDRSTMKQLVCSRFHDIMKIISPDAFDEAFLRSLGVPKQMFKILRLSFEEALTLEKKGVTRELVVRVCERNSIVSPENLLDRFTGRELDMLHCMLYLGDYVTAEEVSEEIGMNRSGVARILGKLEDKGVLAKYRLGRRVVYYIVLPFKLFLEKELLMREFLVPLEGKE